MKKERLIQIMFCVGFCVFLFLPLAFINRDKDGVSVIENKRLARFPRISWRDCFYRESLKQVETFFDENIGFRQKLILKKIKYMYKIFGKIDVPEHLKGKCGHIFYWTDFVRSAWQGLDFDSMDKIAFLTNEIQKFSDGVFDAGSKFIFCPIPNKDQVYPEFMPNGINRIRDVSMLEALADSVEMKTNVKCVNMFRILKEKKEELKNTDELLYYRNIDCSHWNHFGAYICYEAIINAVKKNFSNVQYVTKNDANIKRTIVRKPILWLREYPEIADTFNMADFEYCFAREFTGVQNNNLPDNFSLKNNNTSEYFHYTNDRCGNNRNLLIFGDSYIWTFLLPILAESFQDVYFLSNGVDSKQKKELFDIIHPDVVLFEIVARMASYDLIKEYMVSLNSSFKIK